MGWAVWDEKCAEVNKMRAFISFLDERMKRSERKDESLQRLFLVI